MKRTALLALGMIVLVSACAKPPTPAQKPEAPKTTPSTNPAMPHTSWEGQVVSVIDGDTIEVMHDGRAERIRLHGIDCPESGQAFGTRAKQFCSQAAFGKTVGVQPVDTDQYGRTVAEVYLPQGGSLNHGLVAAGLAWWYQQYAPADQTLKDLEARAREARVGLWRDPSPVAPWDFRHNPQRAPPPTSQPHSRASAAPTDRGQQTVYIAPYSGKRWHTTRNCRGLGRARSVEAISLSEATARGLTPCKICAGG